jgi:hypothetical protein
LFVCFCYKIKLFIFLDGLGERRTKLALPTNRNYTFHNQGFFFFELNN